MKIAIINNLYYPYNKGGAEKIVEQQIKELEKKGHQCFLITTKPQKEESVDKDPQTYYLPSNYYYLGQKSLFYRFFWQIFNFFNFSQAKKIKKILKKEKFDLIISHNLMGITWRIFKLIKKENIQQQHVLHDIQLIHPSGLMFYGQEKKIDSFVAKIYQRIIKRLMGSPQLIISPSQWLLEEHQKRNYFPQSATELRPNSTVFSHLGEEAFSNLNNNKDNKEKRTTVDFLFLGQLEKHKGLLFLIEAWENLKEEKLKLKIIGQGSLGDYVLEKSQNNSQIEFLGYKKSEEIFTELQKVDCLIVPSFCYENSPTVIYEAKYFNLPIIASNLGGIPELLDKEKDFLFEAQNKEDFLEKINLFLQGIK